MRKHAFFVMSQLPFGILPPYRPRRFVPQLCTAGAWEEVSRLFDGLEARLEKVHTSAELETWLIDWGELSAFLDEEGSRRYIAMTCHTDDAAAERAYLEYVEQIEPQSKPRQFALCRRYLEHSQRGKLAQARYLVFDRNTAVAVELYRDENVPLETAEACLGQQYQKLMGGLTVTYEGEERTLTQMAPVLEEPNRVKRQEAWELVARRRLHEADRLDALFDQLLSIRWRIAANAGFASPRDYIFRRLGRFDYTPEDCLRFHDAVEAAVVPLLRRLQAQRRQELGLAELRPWDLAADSRGRPPLRPFRDGEELLQKTQNIFNRLHPALALDFRKLSDYRLLDLDNRKGKAPGGYQSALAEARLPFIFMNAVGLQMDVETLLHEAGHAFHALACAEEDFYAYRSTIPMEFCEVASMSMELLGNEFLEVFYPAEQVRRARKVHLEGIVKALGWIAAVDAFQHWIYTHRDHSPAERNRAWLEIFARFEGDVVWEGFVDVRARLWHRQLHLYLCPFYYIEYGIAQLGALQIWARSCEDREGALKAYRQALALGGSQPLPELFRAAGCRFDFGEATMRPLVERVEAELKQLRDA
jgi:oligoendopeptidase F